MLYVKIGVTFVYNFALRKFDFRGQSSASPKKRGGQRKLRGGQPWKMGAVVWQWIAIPSKRQCPLLVYRPDPLRPYYSRSYIPSRGQHSSHSLFALLIDSAGLTSSFFTPTFLPPLLESASFHRPLYASPSLTQSVLGQLTQQSSRPPHTWHLSYIPYITPPLWGRYSDSLPDTMKQFPVYLKPVFHQKPRSRWVIFT